MKEVALAVHGAGLFLGKREELALHVRGLPLAPACWRGSRQQRTEKLNTETLERGNRLMAPATPILDPLFLRNFSV